MDLRKHHKIFYIPGIISLIFIAIIFYYFGNKYKKSIDLRVMEIVWFEPELLERYPHWFTKPFPPKRNYLKINLTGENRNDKTKLDFSQIHIRELIAKNDSLNGIQFHFADSSKYWTFIRAMDILEIEKAKNYVTFENDLFFFIIPPDTNYEKLPLMICGGSFNEDYTPKPTWIEIIQEKVQIIFQSSWLLILSFLPIIFISIFSLIKTKKL